MVAAALIVLLQLHRVDAIVAVIIIGREIAISALREWMANLGKGKSVAVNLLGKIKTVSQLVAIPLLLYHDRIGAWFDPQWLGTWLIYLAAALTVISMLYYLKLAAPHTDER
jgi:CDP-diacylglycerol--glycerol-3-phosphate 3-phosphatidyltransferase/cardiolipin synthase